MKLEQETADTRLMRGAGRWVTFAVALGIIGLGLAGLDAQAYQGKGGGGSTSPPPIPDVVYLSGTDIYSLNLTGTTASNIRRVMRRVGDNARPCLSPDGRKIVFSGYYGGGGGIWVMDYTGANLVKILNSASSYGCPRWSPTPAADGQYKILYSDLVGSSQWDLFCMNVDGTEKQRLTFQGYAMSGDWSASSNRVVAITGHEDPNPTGAEYHYMAFDVVSDGNGGVMAVNDVDLTLTYGVLPNTRHNAAPAWLNGSDTEFLVTPTADTGGPTDLWKVFYDGQSASVTYLGFPTSYRGWWASPTPANDRIVYSAGQTLYVIGGAGGGTAKAIATGVCPNHRRF